MSSVSKFLLPAVLISIQANAQQDWTRQFGTSGNDSAQSVSLHNGVVYATGSTASPSVLWESTAFLRTYDRYGNLGWVRALASGLFASANAVCAKDDAVFAAGGVGQSAFLQRYDTAGNAQWSRSFTLASGTSTFTTITAMDFHANGVYVAGFYGDIGGGDGFLRKYSAAGVELWTRTLDAWLSGVAAGPFGVFVSGHTSAGSFLRKYDSDGIEQWARTTGGSGVASIGTTIDQNSAYLGGTIESGALPGQIASGARDLFLQRFDFNGTPLWTRQFGTGANDFGGGVSSDGTSIYLTGWTAGTFTGQVSKGQLDMFVRRYDTSGNLVASVQTGTVADDIAYGISGAGGEAYVVGATSGSYNGFANAGGLDAVVKRLGLTSSTNGNSTSGLRFVPVAPCRVVDTRASAGITGPLGPPSLAANATRTLPIPQGQCAIPVTAKAYSLNVTVVPLEPLGYLTLWGEGARPLVSTLNSFHGGVVANAALVPTGLDGIITVYSTNATHLIVDINGYFAGEASTVPALGFYTLNPCRLVDTRLASATGLGEPALSAGVVRGFPLLLGTCQLPTWAQAASLNVTVVPPGPLSYLTLWPAARPQPYVSTLNSFEGLINANAAVVEMSNGVVNAFATETTHLVVDVNGFFGPTGNLGELRLHPIVPCRVADTRADGAGLPLQPSETRDFLVGGVCGVPQGAKGFSMNVTVVPSGPLGYLTLWPAGSARPLVSTLNSPAGRILANAAIVPTGTLGFISVFVTNQTHVILDINGYFN